MSRIKINLLPIDLAAKDIKAAKRNLVIRISSVVVVVVTLITGGVLTFGIFTQSAQQQTSGELEKAQQRVSAYSPQEGYLTTLKQRLGLINSLSGQDFKKISDFNMMLKLVPSGIHLTEVRADKDKEITLSGLGTLDGLQQLFGALSDTDKNPITKVHVNNLSKGPSGYQFELSATLK